MACQTSEGHHCVEHNKHLLRQREEQDQFNAMKQHGEMAYNEVNAMKQGVAQLEQEKQQIKQRVDW
eukprot:12930246-Prorocentrum_lima.AAC.1